MNRRSVLKFLASLPVIGLLVPKKALAKIADLKPVRPKKVHDSETFAHAVKGPMSSEEMASLLIGNLRAQREREKKIQIERHLKTGEMLVSVLGQEMAEEKLCRAMCKYLTDWSLSATYDPDFEKNPRVAFGPSCPVRFDVMLQPMAYIEMPPGTAGDLRIGKAETRKVCSVWRHEMAMDLEALLGPASLDAYIDEAGRQIAIQLQREIRQAEKGWTQSETGKRIKGNPVAVCAFYMPPHMGKCYLDPKDFSVNRTLRMRYAKIHRDTPRDAS